MRFWFIYTIAFISVQAVQSEPNDIIGAGAIIPHDNRQDDLRYVTWHPVEGQEVSLNPPRFRWPWDMANVRIEKSVPAGTRWDFQIAKDRACRQIVFEVRDVAYNFFNAIPALKGSGSFYWRIRQINTKGSSQWSDAREFSIASNARVWDRSRMLDRNSWPTQHPRLYWNADSWEGVMRNSETDPLGQRSRQQILSAATEFVRSKTWSDFPQDDSDKSMSYLGLTKDVLLTALAHKITGNQRFDGHKERMLTIASWEPGQGYSSPEGMPPTQQKWSTHLNELLALYYDWFYHDLTAAERKIIRKSLEWRLNHTLWSFCFTRDKGRTINGNNLSNRGASHAYQNLMVSLTGCIAVWDELPVAEEGLEWALNYLSGITTGFGKIETHNEGPGYGNGKTTWLADAAWAVRTAMPQVHIEQLPQLEGLIEFFNWLTPIGLQHSSWGNRGFREVDWTDRRYSGNILLGYLTGNGQAIANAESSALRLQELGHRPSIYSPWVGLSAAWHRQRSVPSLETKTVRAWPLTGWVSAGTQAPSDYDNWKNNVGIIFHARPLGSYGHAFASDNAFDLFAYGQTLAHGGGGTQNRDQFADASMSHNTVLINGQGQNEKQERAPYSARLVAFEEHPDYVYMAGDATNAYASNTGLQRFIRHVLFMHGKYFIVYDDLAADRPAEYQWLYHLNPDAGLQINPGKGFDLGMNGVNLRVRHIAQSVPLKIENRPGDLGRVNPLTGEDHTFAVGLKRGSRLTEEMRYAQHIWVNAASPTTEHHFLAVLYPYRKDERPGIIERLNDRSFSVTMPDGTRDIVAFGDSVPGATVVVDIDAIRKGASQN